MLLFLCPIIYRDLVSYSSFETLFKFFEFLNLNIKALLHDCGGDIAEIAGLLDGPPVAYLPPIGNEQSHGLRKKVKFFCRLKITTVYCFTELVCQQPYFFLLG